MKDKLVEGRRILTDFRLEMDYGLDVTEKDFNLYKGRFNGIDKTEKHNFIIKIKSPFKHIKSKDKTFFAKCKFSKMFFLIPKEKETLMERIKFHLEQNDDILIKLIKDCNTDKMLVEEVLRVI